MIGSLWRYRRFIWENGLGDFRHRYAGSGLGVFWNVFSPLAQLAIYAFVFTHLLAPRFAGLSPGFFPLYLSAGFLSWRGFAEGVQRGTRAFVQSTAYVKKMPAPEQVFVAPIAVSATVVMLIKFALLIGLALVLGQPAQWTWLLLPIVAVLWQAFAFGLAVGLSTLNVFFRDVEEVLAVVMQIWMWSVPVVYFEELLPEAFRATLPFNPAYPFLQATRAVFLYGELPAAWVWLAMLSWGGVASILGSALLGRLRAELRDQL